MVRTRNYETLGALLCSCGRNLYRTPCDLSKCAGCGYVSRTCRCGPVPKRLRLGDRPDFGTDVRWWRNRRRWAQRQRR